MGSGDREVVAAEKPYCHTRSAHLNKSKHRKALV